MTVRIYDHQLSDDDADVRVAIVDAWWLAAYPARGVVREGVDFATAWGGPPWGTL